MILTHPYWLLGLIPLALYLGLALRQRAGLKLKRRNIFFAAEDNGAKLRPLLLLFVTGSLLLLALAEPVVYRLRPVLKRSGIDISIGIDISKSMLAEDITFPISTKEPAPLKNRLNRARMMVLELLNHLDGERVGVFVFAAQSYELVPLTSDYGYCRYLVENLDELTLSTPGSDLAAGLESGFNMLDRNPDATTAIILLISDGEETENTPNLTAEINRKVQQDNYRIYTLGVGREKESLIPIRTPDGKQIVDYYKDETGNFLTTTMQSARLKELAVSGDGAYWALKREEIAPQVMEKILADLGKSERSTVYEKLPYSLSSGLLATAFITFLLTL